MIEKFIEELYIKTIDIILAEFDKSDIVSIEQAYKAYLILRRIL